MPEISRFYGIVVQMYYADHPPPHFHARYAGDVAKIDIEALSVIEGRLSGRALSMVMEWATLHQEELRQAFSKAANMEAPGKIDPLP
jgi:hypothetical protein